MARGVSRKYQDLLNFTLFPGPSRHIDSITLPDGWIVPNTIYKGETSSSAPNLPSPKEESLKIIGETTSEVPDLRTYEKVCSGLKVKMETNFEPLDILRKKFDDQIANLESMKSAQDQITGNLNALEEKFKKNMGMIKGFIEEIQDFVNKLERRVLQLEHCVFQLLMIRIVKGMVKLLRNKNGKIKTKGNLFLES